MPVDMALPRNSKWGASADHEPPLALTGELLPSMDGAGIAHLDCNRRHGANLAKKLHATTLDPFFREASVTPHVPRLLFPQGVREGQGRA
jgi:hypothetical protein